MLQAAPVLNQRVPLRAWISDHDHTAGAVDDWQQSASVDFTSRDLESIGKENAEKVRKYFLKIVKAAEKDTKEGASREGRPTPKGERKTLTPDAFHELVQEQMRAASK